MFNAWKIKMEIKILNSSFKKPVAKEPVSSPESKITNILIHPNFYLFFIIKKPDFLSLKNDFLSLKKLDTIII